MARFCEYSSRCDLFNRLSHSYVPIRSVPRRIRNFPRRIRSSPKASRRFKGNQSRSICCLLHCNKHNAGGGQIRSISGPGEPIGGSCPGRRLQIDSRQKNTTPSEENIISSSEHPIYKFLVRQRAFRPKARQIWVCHRGKAAIASSSH
jgi:hypothetical protein